MAKKKIRVYGVLEMWEAYLCGKNDGKLSDFQDILDKKV